MIGTLTYCALSSQVAPGISAEAPTVPAERFCELRLGPLLGRGSYGRVYRGVYRGQPIAVKVGKVVSAMQPERD